MSDGGNQSYGEDDYEEVDENEVLDAENEVEVLEDEDDEDMNTGAFGQSGDGFKNKRGYTKNKEKITSNFLTKYERARVLGTRAL